MELYDNIFFGNDAQLVNWMNKTSRKAKGDSLDDYIDCLLDLVGAKLKSKDCFQVKLWRHSTFDPTAPAFSIGFAAIDNILVPGYILKTKKEELIVTTNGLKIGTYVSEGCHLNSTGMLQDDNGDDLIHISKIKYIDHVKNTKLIQDEDVNYALEGAARNGHVEFVRMLLADSRVDPTVNDNYTLYLAAQYCRSKVVEILLADKRVASTFKSSDREIQKLLNKCRF